MRNGVYILREDSNVSPSLNFKKKQEFEVVNEVIYIGGHLLPPIMQGDVYKWMNENTKLFINDTRNF